VANTIRIKKRAASGSDGAPSTLFPSELAFNESDLKLYYGFGDNGSTPPSASSIITVGGAGAFFNKTDTRTANTILSGPTTGSAAAPTFRALVAADIPSIAHTKISDFDTGVQVNRLDQMAAPTAAVGLNSQKITSLAAPTADTDAATKAYVDSTSEGLDVKDSCVVISTSNITLANTQTIDGVSLAANNRVLVAGQSTASQNGIYKVVDGGSWTRTDDFAAGADAAGAFTFIEQGTSNADTGWVCSSNKGSAVIGTNNLAFTQFSSAGVTTAGDGLDRTGNVFSVDLKSNGGLVIESTELALDLAASSITGTLPVSKLTSVTSTAAELNILDGVTSTAAELNILDGVTSTATEINVLDGITATTTELNLMDGGTSASSTTLATADRFVCNDAGTMKQVALSDLVTFLEDGSTSGFDVDGGTY
jgi:hypothetical protein